MPPIPSHFLDAVVFLYPDKDAAKAGEGYGGSGFVASVPVYGPDVVARYLVTNQHVARRARVARLTTHEGKVEFFDTPEGGWKHHPDGDDVSVFALDVGEHAWRFPAIQWGTFAHEYFQAIPGDDIFFVGRFIRPDGKQLDVPTARFGHIALSGTTKLWQKERQVNQESFLVEALSLAGYSGSPVLVFRLQLETPFMGGVKLSIGQPADRHLDSQQGRPGEPVLLGIDWGHVLDPAPVYERQEEGEDVEHDDLYVKQNRGMAGVVPAWKITELLQDEELQEMRDEQRKDIEKQPGGTSLDEAGKKRPEEFERFEDLTRKLVNTPKEEVDEKRKDES